MSSSGMLLLLSALLLHGSAGNSTGHDTSRDNSESCSGRQADVEGLACANDSVKAFLNNLRNLVCQHSSVNSTCMCVTSDTELAVVTLRDIMANFTVFAKDCGCTVPCCRNAAEADEFKELLEKVWMILKQPQVIAAFLTGVLLSAFVCFLGGICRRKKQRGSGNKADGVATSQAVPLTDGQPREVEYSDIDFSRWNRNSPAGGEHAQGAPETEYAELQKDGNRQEPEENSGDSEEDVAVAIDEEETEQ